MAGRSAKGKKEAIDIGEQLVILTEKVDHIGSRQDEISVLIDEIKRLREQNKYQALRIADLETRVDDLEAYTRRENVIVAGLSVKSKSYSRVVADGIQQTDESAPHAELQNLEDKVIEYFEGRDIELDRNQISACHQLGKVKRGQPSPIVIRFVNRKEKIKLLSQRKKLNGTEVYINEHLTRKNAQLAQHARGLKKAKQITGT